MKEKVEYLVKLGMEESQALALLKGIYVLGFRDGNKSNSTEYDDIIAKFNDRA